MVSRLLRQLHRSSGTKVRSRQFPDKIWINWCLGPMRSRIFVWLMEGKNFLVMCEVLSSLVHSSLHCFFRWCCRRFLTLDYAVPTFFIEVLRFVVKFRSYWSASSFPGIPSWPRTHWNLTVSRLLSWSAIFWIFEPCLRTCCLLYL